MMKKLIAYVLLVASMLGITTNDVYASNCADGSKKVTVKITYPTSIPAKYVLKDSDFEISQTLRAQSSGGTDSKLKWKYGEFTFPEGDTGTSVIAKQTTWPDKASFFGEKKIELEYVGGTGTCKDSKDIKFLFPPMQLISSTPAWYKYWPDKATPELSNFNLSTLDLLGGMAQYMNGAWGLCKSTWSYSVSPWLDLSFKYTATYFIATEAYEGGGNLNHEKKIENIAEVIAHEKGHHEYNITVRKPMVESWWASLSTSDKEDYKDGEKNLRNAIAALIDTVALDAASETFALSKNKNYADFVTTSEDWSEGGENDN